MLSFKNSFGEFSLYHIEDQRSYGANGITTNVSTQFCISLYETYSVDKIVRECWSVKNFFKILSGQDDCISKLLIKKEGDVEAGYFEIYLSTDTVEHSDLYFDSLLNAKMEKSVLNNIFQNWFDKHDEWKDARNQLCHTYSSNNYDVDRVVRCANIFDLIPDKAMIELSEDLIEAKNKAKKIFRELPDSLEKTSLLQALGRLGIKTLKDKINDRIEIILSNCKIKFDGLQFVAHQAVDCRNYFVHGGNKKFDYESNLNMVNFLTDTLEFIFVVSDLIECGWDIDDWLKSFALSHKVGQYCIAYPHYLTELNSIISNSSS
ncbi:hypothetical protein K5S30_10335 [Shewanella xiamenensis]|nr:hypothetical protein [Shewanella xiamenensis]